MSRRANYQDIEEEPENCHYHLETPKHSYLFFGFWAFFIFIIILFAQATPYGGIYVPWDNCDKTMPWEPSIRKFVNDEQYKSEVRKIAKFREENQLWIRNNFTRIEYGTTELSYCKEEFPLFCDKMRKKAIVQLSTGIKIKSILRTIELNPYVASCLRCVVLLTMSFRIVMAVFRTSDVLTGRHQPLQKSLQLIFSMLPYITCLQAISLFWITALHSEFDRPIGKYHPYAFIFLGIFTFAEMFSELLLDSVDTRIIMVKTWKFYTKCVFFVIFCLAYPHVVLNWIQFFKQKRCQAYVPIFDGLLEYSCAVSIAVFHFLNALVPVQMFITPTIDDIHNITTYTNEVYYPFFKSKQKVASSLSTSDTVIYESLGNLSHKN